MNIDIFCYLSSANRAHTTSKINIERNNIIVSRPNGPSFKFTNVFKDQDHFSKFQQTCLRPLINEAINGFNSSLLLFGESDSDKSVLLAGSSSSQPGIFATTISDIFSLLDSDERFRSTYSLHLRMFEVHNDLLVDLIEPYNPSKFSIDNVTFTPEDGFQITGMTELKIVSASQSVVQFRDCWNRRIVPGKADLHACIVIQIRLFLKNVEEAHQDTVSQLSLVCLPGDDDLPESQSGQNNKGGMMEVRKVLEGFNKPGAIYGSYSHSLLTSVLEDELGGNCFTAALLCLPVVPSPEILAAQLETLGLLAAVRTSPIVNTLAARRLLHGLRLQRNELLLGFLGGASVSPARNLTEVVGVLKQTQRENAELRDKMEVLRLRLEKLHGRYSNAVMDRSNISDDFIQSEEEKLRASKRIMELEIESSKSKEKLETLRFDLSNKILHLEERLANKEIEKSFYTEDAKALKVVNAENLKLKSLNHSLQRSYDDLKSETGLIVSKNKELNTEFLNMLKVKRKVAKNESEVDNIISMNDILQIGYEHKDPFRLNHDRKPLSDISGHQGGLVKLRLGKLQRDLLRARQTAQERLQHMSKASIDLIVLKDENNHLSQRVNDLTRTLQAATKEYQQNIRKYSTNLSSLLDSTSTNQKQYKDEIIKMLQKYDFSHIVAENNLKNLLNDNRKQFESLRMWSERIVYEYINLRQLVFSKGLEVTNIGPDPFDIVVEYSLPSDYLKAVTDRGVHRSGSNMMELKQQVKEFSNTTQSSLEIERAQLLARNAEIEEELIAAQNYIDIYIKKSTTKAKK